VGTQPDDEISADPKGISSPVALGWVVVLLAAALAGAMSVALHYRGEVAALHRQLRSVRAPVARPSLAPPTLSSTTTDLPSSGPLAGEVTAFVARSSTGLAQVIVTARISGGRPRSRYELSGGDCAGNAADHPWAVGVTNGRGSAELTGHAWTVSGSDEYYLVLGSADLDQNHPGPAVHGYFGPARGLSAVHNGFAPCDL
jgi:hypothetical protein